MYNGLFKNMHKHFYIFQTYKHVACFAAQNNFNFPHVAFKNMSFYFHLYNKTKLGFMAGTFLGGSFGRSVLGPAQIAWSPFTLFVWHARRQTALRALDIITGRLSFLWRVSETAEPPGTMTTKPLSPFWHKNTPAKP